MADARQSQPEKSGALEEWRRLVIGREVEEVVRYAYRWTQSRESISTTVYLFTSTNKAIQRNRRKNRRSIARETWLESRRAWQCTESHEEGPKHKPPQQPPHSFPQRCREGKKTK